MILEDPGFAQDFLALPQEQTHLDRIGRGGDGEVELRLHERCLKKWPQPDEPRAETFELELTGRPVALCLDYRRWGGRRATCVLRWQRPDRPGVWETVPPDVFFREYRHALRPD